MAQIDAAAARLRGHAVRTPLLENAQLNEIAGGRVLLKLETQQHTGSFKFRGAYNRLVQLDPAHTRPWLVLDVYEHAFHMDYGAAAARYIDAWLAILNWDTVPARG